MRSTPPCSPHHPPSDRPRTGDTEIDSAEDLIVGWLAGPPVSSSSQEGADVACGWCGYDGPMPTTAEDAGLLCPACGIGRRARPEPKVILVTVCPYCGREIEVLETHRGRTMVCPGCRAFLGCLAPQIVDRPWRRRWSLRG